MKDKNIPIVIDSQQKANDHGVGEMYRRLPEYDPEKQVVRADDDTDPAIKLGGDPDRPLGEHGATGHYYNPPEPVRFHGSQYYRAEMPKLAEIGKNDMSITMAKNYLEERIVLNAGEIPTSIHFCGAKRGGATITPRADGKTEVRGWIAK